MCLPPPLLVTIRMQTEIYKNTSGQNEKKWIKTERHPPPLPCTTKRIVLLPIITVYKVLVRL